MTKEIPTPVCGLVRNDSVVRGARSPLQIPICRTPPFRDVLYLISQILYLFLSSRVSYLANRVLRVVDQLSPGARMAAAGFSSQLMEPPSWLGRLCQGSMQTNWGFPGLLQIRV